MKRLFVITFLVLSVSVFSQEEIDTVANADEQFGMVDSLEYLLKDWYYYTGRDTLIYYSENDYEQFEIDVPDSVFRERIEKLNTPINVAYNSNVQRFLDKYIKKSRWYAPKFLGLSQRYFPLFEEKLDAYGIPLELKYLPIIESALNPKARSRVGATGLWQFMYKTGLKMGLEITSYVDERMSPMASTDAACRYLKFLYETYNDWTLALAAYNAGPGNINKAIARSGKNTYWEIYPYLPNETRNYVPGYIAVMYMFEYADAHNFKPEKFDFFEDVDTVLVTKQLHFVQLDSVLGIPVTESRDLNPQYKLDIVPAKDKSYPLLMQRKYVSKFIELEDSIYAYNDSVLFCKQNVEKIMASSNANYYAPSAQPAGTAAITYVVKSGDVLGSIASKYHVSVNSLKSWNGLGSNMIRVGQKLKVYVPQSQKSKYESSSTTVSTQKTSSSSSSTQKLDSNYEYYTVKAGDTPRIIAAKYPGVTADDIIRLNGINPSKLQIGQKLKIRRKS